MKLFIFAALLVSMLVMATMGPAGALSYYPMDKTIPSYVQTDVRGTNNVVGLVAVQSITPAASDDDRLLLVLNNSSVTGWSNKTTFSAQPDVPRTIVITANKTTTGGAYVFGTDANGAAIYELVNWTNASGTKTTAAAFKTVTKIAFNKFTQFTTFKAGTAGALGLNSKLAGNSTIMATMAGVKSGISSATYSSTYLSRNTVTLTAAYAGTAVKIWYFV
jgi:hypothetical protein